MGAPRGGTNLGGGMVEKDGIVFNQNAINNATNGLSLVDLDTNVDPYRNVMSLDQARAYNDRLDPTNSTSGSGGDMHSSTAKIYLDRAELDRAVAEFDADEAAHGLYSNSAGIRAGIDNNYAILNKADFDLMQQAKDFGWEYGKTAFSLAAGEGFGFLAGKAIGAGIPLLAKFGQAAESAGPGIWRTVNEAMSGRAAAYQSQITGRAGESYLVNGLKFDGFEAGTLLDAKGPGYATFVKGGEFRSFFRGQDSLLSQAQRQVTAAQGVPVTWHVAESTAADAMRALLSTNRVKGITVVHTPVAP
jgi:hypothetical protein